MITINNTSGTPPNNYLTQLLANSDPDIDITAAILHDRRDCHNGVGRSNNDQGVWSFELTQTAPARGPLLAVSTDCDADASDALDPISLNLTESQVHWQNTCTQDTQPTENCGDSDKDDGGTGGGVHQRLNGGSVPEPASVTLFGIGLLGAAWRARRHRVVN